jgi:predicted DNA-binding ribbon-helix-helix protein
MSSLIPRNVRVNGRRTSVRLEQDMWDALKDICAREGMSLDQICAHVAGSNGERGFTSSLRVFIVNYYRGRGRQLGRPAGRDELSQHHT